MERQFCLCRANEANYMKKLFVGVVFKLQCEEDNELVRPARVQESNRGTLKLITIRNLLFSSTNVRYNGLMKQSLSKAIQ